MPKIINAYQEGQNSIADSLKDIGQSIWGDAAKNEGYRQSAEKTRREAEKVARENANAEPYARALRDNDTGNARYYGALHGLPPEGVAIANRLAAAGHANGDMYDPMLGTAMLGAGASAAGTPRGHREMLENQRMQLTYGVTDEDPRTGAKNYGWRDPRTMSTAPPNTGLGQPNAPSGNNPLLPRGNAPNGNTPQATYTPADLLTDERGQPVQIPAAPLHMTEAVDENGQPVLDARGKQALEAVRQKYGDGYASKVLGTVLGHGLLPSSRSKANNAFIDDVYNVYPGYDPGVAAMRNKTWQDIASSGKTGQMTTALGQFMHHLGEKYIPAVEGIGTVDTLHPFSGAGPLPAAGNWIAGQGTNAYNAAHIQSLRNQGAPQITALDAAQEAVANEYAKVLRTTGMAESDVQRNMAIFKPGNSPAQAKAAIDTALGVIHGAYASREGTINRLLMAPHPPLVDQETQGLEGQIKSWLGGGKAPVIGKGLGQMQSGVPVGTGGGGGTQPATALPPGPTGHPPSVNDTAPPPAPGARSSFDDRFSAAGEPPLLAEARAAIAAGKSRTAVIQRLQQMGVDPAGL